MAAISSKRDSPVSTTRSSDAEQENGNEDPVDRGHGSLVIIVGCHNSKDRIEDNHLHGNGAHRGPAKTRLLLGGQLQTGIPTQEDDYTVAYGAGYSKGKIREFPDQ